MIKPKGKGRGLMVSDFIDEHDGFLALTPDEAAEVPHLSRRKAREILKYGAEQEGYWNSNRFMGTSEDCCGYCNTQVPS